MELNMDKHPDLADCGPTIQFIRYINKVIKAMTSRCIKNCMRWQNEHYNLCYKIIGNNLKRNINFHFFVNGTNMECFDFK